MSRTTKFAALGEVKCVCRRKSFASAEVTVRYGAPTLWSQSLSREPHGVRLHVLTCGPCGQVYVLDHDPVEGVLVLTRVKRDPLMALWAGRYTPRRDPEGSPPAAPAVEKPVRIARHPTAKKPMKPKPLTPTQREVIQLLLAAGDLHHDERARVIREAGIFDRVQPWLRTLAIRRSLSSIERYVVQTESDHWVLTQEGVEALGIGSDSSEPPIDYKPTASESDLPDLDRLVQDLDE